MAKTTKFQDSPWYVRVWRYRWYLMIAWWTFVNRFTPWLDADGSLAKVLPWNTWKIAHSIAVGTAQMKMNWCYDWDVVKKEFTD